MAPADIRLFASFVLSDKGRTYFRWQFDERLGPATDPGPAYSPEVREAARALSRIRVDAVGWDGTGPTVMEVKPEAKLGALGQIAAYRFFFCRDKGIGCRAAIISDFFPPYTKEFAEHFDIETYLVRPASPQEVLRAIRQTNPHSLLDYGDIRYLFEDLEGPEEELE